MDEESASLRELLFSCYKIIKIIYYNIINRKKDTVFLIHSLFFVSTEKLLRYKWKR